MTFPEVVRVYAGPSIAVGDEHPPNKLKTDNPTITFLVNISYANLIHSVIQLKVEFLALFFILNLTKFNVS